MVTGWPTPYEPLFDPEVKIDSLKPMRAGLKSDLKKDIDFHQNEIALMTRIKEQVKDDQDIQRLCASIIEDELLIIKESWKELNGLYEF